MSETTYVQETPLTDTPQDTSEAEVLNDLLGTDSVAPALTPSGPLEAYAEEIATDTAAVTAADQPVKKRRGRLPGSKNKKKETAASAPAATEEDPVKKRRGRQPGTKMPKKVGKKKMGRPVGSKNKPKAGKVVKAAMFVKATKAAKAAKGPGRGRWARKTGKVAKAAPGLKTKGLVRSIRAGVKQIEAGIKKMLRVMKAMS